jgi:hypothetical protein
MASSHVFAVTCGCGALTDRGGSLSATLPHARSTCTDSSGDQGKWTSTWMERLDLQTYCEGMIDGVGNRRSANDYIFLKRGLNIHDRVGRYKRRCYSIGIKARRFGRSRKKNYSLRCGLMSLFVRGNSLRPITMVAVRVPGGGATRVLNLAIMVFGATRFRRGSLAISANGG